MSAAKHTPGPWRFNEENGVVTDQEEGRSVAYIAGRSRAFGHERLTSACFNGRLIATAPELLRFAEEMANEMNCVCKGKIGEIQKLIGTDVVCRKCQAEAAIRKARGER